MRHIWKNHLGKAITVVLTMATLAYTATGWNLPYTRPAKYDFSALFAPDLKEFVASHPDFLAAELAKGWQYYKETFMMSNGLINHQRGASEGVNEAVSEGQGYGMLLAALCNDQPAFNKIFEAANQYLWKSEKQSYFIWNWPSMGQGSATDADLDIGLALIFADKLVARGHWNTYNQNGITYQSRALDIIKSIRNNMCSQDYLLPGDNWGGSGLDNQNPSYFAVSYMRVFDAYQNQVSFAPVIAKCYQVLKANSSQYAKGQAPDWCTRSGGYPSFGSKNMGNDGIRTPWRIALDALWFGTADAKTYCGNAKNTITQYTNADTKFALAQMGLYNQDGSIMSGTGGSFDYVAMWGCAVAGSLDPAFSTKVLTQKFVQQIIGSTANPFGDPSVSDHLYYFKQSLGLLGFATITGQFPNPLDEPGTVIATSSFENQNKHVYRTRPIVAAASTFCCLTLESNTTYQVHIIDMCGRTRSTHTVTANPAGATRIAMPALGAGRYSLRLSNAAGTQVIPLTIH